jgi:hypothetical protein
MEHTREVGCRDNACERAVVPAEALVRFAGDDLDRWRELIGCAVVHRHPGWGRGRVTDVRWGTCCAHVPYYVQVRVVFSDGLSTVVRAGTFAASFSCVEVARWLRDLIHTCYVDSALDEAQREARMARYAAELRERRDRERLQRVAVLRRRAAERKRGG